MRFIRKLPDISYLKEKLALSEEQMTSREQVLCQIQNILSGKDNRKILIVGPCSADREDSVLDYMSSLAELSEKVKDVFLIVPRVYTSKPRTTGLGYKGMLHNPNADEKEDIFSGISAARRLHIKVIQETGLYTADEMLYPEEIYYLSDILVYLAVGARSVENQGHRMVASDDAIPVGLKNPIGGSKLSLINSVKAAQVPHNLIYCGWEVETDGNAFAHAILRGYVDNNGKNHSNYHYEDLCELYDLFYKNNLRNPSVIVDCNHSNSNKKYDHEPRIAKEVFGFCKEDESLNKFVKGLMIESYIKDGSQLLGEGEYGKSITDPCIGWEKTERLLLQLADNVI